MPLAPGWKAPKNKIIESILYCLNAIEQDKESIMVRGRFVSPAEVFKMIFERCFFDKVDLSHEFTEEGLPVASFFPSSASSQTLTTHIDSRYPDGIRILVDYFVKSQELISNDTKKTKLAQLKIALQEKEHTTTKHYTRSRKKRLVSEPLVTSDAKPVVVMPCLPLKKQRMDFLFQAASKHKESYDAFQDALARHIDALRFHTLHLVHVTQCIKHPLFANDIAHIRFLLQEEHEKLIEVESSHEALAKFFKEDCGEPISSRELISALAARNKAQVEFKTVLDELGVYRRAPMVCAV